MEKPVVGSDFWMGLGSALVVALPIHAVIVYIAWKLLKR